MDQLSRRSMLKGSVLAAGAAALSLSAVDVQARKRKCVPAGLAQEKGMKRYTNDRFYKDGKFLEDVAKEAYFEMFRYYNYPLTDQLREGLWVMDFGMGDFVNCGMGGIFWVNNKEFSYFGHEIYLLPLQMIGEHKHITTTVPCKMEAWQVRYGSIYNFGEGEATNPPLVDLPESQKDTIVSKHCELLKQGEIRELKTPEAWHFMMGGPEGAIVTEYGRYHDMAGLRFNNPKGRVENTGYDK